jgi:hypothetical protein
MAVPRRQGSRSAGERAPPPARYRIALVQKRRARCARADAVAASRPESPPPVRPNRARHRARSSHSPRIAHSRKTNLLSSRRSDVESLGYPGRAFSPQNGPSVKTRNSNSPEEEDVNVQH